MASTVQVIPSGAVTIIIDDREVVVPLVQDLQAPDAIDLMDEPGGAPVSGKVEAAGSFSFKAAQTTGDGAAGGMFSGLFAHLAGGSSWASAPPAPPEMTLTRTNRKGPRSYAVLCGGRHIATRKRLGNAERLAASCGGYVLPIGGGVKWSQTARIAAVRTADARTSVDFEMLGKPEWRRGR